MPADRKIGVTAITGGVPPPLDGVPVENNSVQRNIFSDFSRALPRNNLFPSVCGCNWKIAQNLKDHFYRNRSII